MLISDSHRLILMLPEKCCSSTLQVRLADIHTVREFGAGSGLNNEINKFLTKHVQIKQAVQLSAYKERDNYLKACFVRTPYDRVYSWFLWIKRLNEKREQAGFIEKAEAELQSKHHDEHSPLVRQLHHSKAIRALLDQSHHEFNQFLKIAPKQFRLNSKFTHLKRKCLMDFIGHVECFDQDYIRLCDTIGYQNDSKLNMNVITEDTRLVDPQRMRIEDHKYLNFYNAASVAYINKAYKPDFKYFGYQQFKPKLFPKEIALG